MSRKSWPYGSGLIPRTCANSPGASRPERSAVNRRLREASSAAGRMAVSASSAEPAASSADCQNRAIVPSPRREEKRDVRAQVTSGRRSCTSARRSGQVVCEGGGHRSRASARGSVVHPQLPAVDLRGGTEPVPERIREPLMRPSPPRAKLFLRENGIVSREDFQLSRRRQNQSKRDPTETDEADAELDEGHLGPRRAGLFSTINPCGRPLARATHCRPDREGEERVVVGALRVGAFRLCAVLEVEELAHRGSTTDRFPRCVPLRCR